MATKHLPVKPSKVHSASSAGTDCLGVEVNGQDFTIGVRPAKLQQLIYDTKQVLVNGACTGRAMAQLVGRWTWAMLVYRPALSAFNAVYRFSRMADRMCWFLWASVRVELECVMGLAPLLWASMKNPWFTRVPCTDASLDGEGVCATEDITPAVMEEVSSQSPVDSAIIQSIDEHKWSVIVSHPWGENHEHINSLELRSILTSRHSVTLQANDVLTSKPHDPWVILGWQ